MGKKLNIDSINLIGVSYSVPTPDAGFIKLYPKDDGNWYTKNSGGTESLFLGGVNGNIKPLKTLTGTTYSLVADDVNWFLSFDNVSAITVTIPSGIFVTGQYIEGRQGSTGQVTFVGGGGFVLERALDEATPIKIAIQYGVFGLRVHSSGIGQIFGKLELI